MRTHRFVLFWLVGLAVAGCQSDAQVLASEQTVAMQAAVRRAQFEMNCPQAKGTVLSSNVLQPIVWAGWSVPSTPSAFEGCGQPRTYISVCQVGGPACFAASGR